MQMSETQLFGTDGVRGLANVDLTAEMAFGLARAAGDGRSGSAVIGRDTRRSGQMLVSAVRAGFNAAGFDVVDAGIIPVGGVSYLTGALGADMAVMVSASHNPAPDNGIKFLGADGSKLDDVRESAIEARYRVGAPWHPISGEDVGIGTDLADGVERYVAHLAAQADHGVDGLEVVLDCANGAAVRAAPMLFARLGARAEAINVEPTGMNINDGCGAVHPEGLAEHADGRVGLAFDGDADRLIAVDEDGRVCNGDVIMAILARYLKGRGELPGNTVVSTVMANLGFVTAMNSLGIDVVRTPVGDRHVYEEMRRRGAGLGGEQSGHVLLHGRPTGDGLLTGLRLLEVMAATAAPLRELRRIMVEYPQVLRNVHVRVKDRLADADAVWAAVQRLEKRLGDDGRILVRASGTEQLVRVMVEAKDSPEAAAVAEELVTVVRAELGEA
jgi:phosphoglucosamine mutase